MFEKPVAWVKRLGPWYLTHQFFANVNSHTKRTIALPCSYFYPLPWPVPDSGSPADYILPESLGMHLWEGSWIASQA